MEENIVERPIIPRNPSPAKVVQKEKYLLYAPIARTGQVGMAAFDPESFVVKDGVVRTKISAVSVSVGDNESAVVLNDSGAKAYTYDTVAMNLSTQAGLRGYEIIGIDKSENCFTLDTVEGLLIGDVVSYSWYDDVNNGWCPGIDNGTIINIVGNKIYLSEPIANIKEGLPVPEDSNLAYRVSVRLKPQLGTKDVTGRAVAINYETVATGDGSFTKGRNTKARGDYSEAGGRDTTADGEGARAHGWGGHAKAWYSHVDGMFSIAEESAE